MIKVTFRGRNDEPDLELEWEGFEVSTTDIYTASNGKRCAGLQANWETGSKMWRVYGHGYYHGASFSSEDGLELSVNQRKPFSSGSYHVSVYGSHVGGREGLITYVHDVDGENAGSDPWGWLEDKKRRRQGKTLPGSLFIQAVGSYRPRTQKAKRQPTLIEAPEPRIRLSALAERQAA